MREELECGYCSHPAASPTQCKGGVTRAHTVQRRGGLAAIAEAGHVLTFKPTLKAMIEHNGRPPPRSIGIGRASVFPGFCNRHDSDLFKAVEGQDLSLDGQGAFLLSYRAIAYERFSKEVQLESLGIQRQMDKGHPFWKQVSIQRQIHPHEWGARRGLADVTRWKADYDSRLLSGALDGFHFLAVRFSGLLPIVACGAFHAEVDLSGNLLQRLARGDGDLEHLALNITSYRGQTVMVLGWIGSTSGPAAAFAQSFSTLDDARKADSVVRMAFEQSDNIFIRQSWWAGLPTDQQQRLMEQMWSGTPQAKRRMDSLVDRGSNLAFADVVDLVTG